MARGFFSKWKQLVFLDYDKPLTAEVVNDILTQLYEAGFTVVSITSDLGPTNSSRWTSLDIGIKDNQQCFFTHPCDSSLKVFVFADPPDLLKLIRNNFIDHGFNIDGVFIGKEYIEKFLLLNKSE